MSAYVSYVSEIIEHEDALDVLAAMVIAWSATRYDPLAFSLRRIHGIKDRDFTSAFNKALEQIKRDSSFKNKAIECLLRAVEDIRVRKEVEEVGWHVSTPQALQKIMAALEDLASKIRMTRGLQTLLLNLSHIYESRFATARLMEEPTTETKPEVPPSHEFQQIRETPSQVMEVKHVETYPGRPPEQAKIASSQQLPQISAEKPVEKVVEVPKTPSHEVPGPTLPKKQEEKVKEVVSEDVLSRVEKEIQSIRQELSEIKQVLTQLSTLLETFGNKIEEKLSQSLSEYVEKISSKIDNVLSDLREDIRMVLKEKEAKAEHESEIGELIPFEKEIAPKEIKEKTSVKVEEKITEEAKMPKEEEVLIPIPAEEEILPTEEEIAPPLKTEEKVFVAIGNISKLQNLLGAPQETFVWVTNVVIGDTAYNVRIQGLKKGLPRDIVEKTLKDAVGIIIAPFDTIEKNQKLWKIIPIIAKKISSLKVIGILSESVPENIQSLGKIIAKKISRSWETILFLEDLIKACGE